MLNTLGYIKHRVCTTMDLLLDVQLQLSRVVTSMAQPSQSFATSCPTSTALMTPVLIYIEQLLDEIRATTRAIVSKHSVLESTAIPSANSAKTSAKFADFRAKLESEDVTGYTSETGTEDEEKYRPAEEQRGSGEIREGVGGKRSRECEDNEDEPPCKRQDTHLETEKGIQLRHSVNKVVQCIAECSGVSKDTQLEVMCPAVTRLVQASAHAIKQMRKLTQDERVPNAKLAKAFSDAVMQLLEIIIRHHVKREVSPKWVAATSANLKHIFHYTKKHPAWPICLSDSAFEATSGAIRGLCETAAPDLLRKMEVLIECVSEGGQLNADRIEQPLGKLGSLFRTDFKAYKAKENTTRSEEEWSRFAVIGKVLAEWIYEAQKAKEPPKMQAYLRRFDRQRKGFAKKNPNRVPTILLKASTILAGWVSLKNARKPETDPASG
ncbi:hypothetical protein V7S43_014309 [Phytophthora oleae]|uniref:Uncharacterized protein n=1 Tax=Phytophthora oleae TaxID=2107226 RepID=A0ABD3F2R2_9STRA